MTVQLSRGQFLILKAASEVDYLPIRARHQSNLQTGVWRSLVTHGYLSPVPDGWQITLEGRRVLTGDIMLRGEPRMSKKLPRYCVTRTITGWAIVDRHIDMTEEQKNVVEFMPSRHAARMKVGQLNLMEGKQDAATNGQ